MIIQIELSDANELDYLSGSELLPAQSSLGKPIKISTNQILEFIKSSPINSFKMITSGTNADQVLITLTDDFTFQFTKI